VPKLYFRCAPMRRFCSFVPPLVRVRVVAPTAALAFSWLAVVASCSSSPRSNDSPKDDADAKVRAAPSCPVSTDASRCSGNDPTFIFFPAFICDPSSSDDASLGDATPDDGRSTDGGDNAVVDVSTDGADDAMADAGTDEGDGAAADASADAEVAVANLCGRVTLLDVYFTPQACQAFVSAVANGNVANGSDPSAPFMTDPADGDLLTPDRWSIFTWDRPTRDSRRDWLERAVDLVEPSAYAYSPLRGDAYVLEFTQGCTEILRVMLAEKLWVPDPASWALLSSLDGPVQVRVFWMRFAGDALISTPVPSVPIVITMQGDAGNKGVMADRWRRDLASTRLPGTQRAILNGPSASLPENTPH